MEKMAKITLKFPVQLADRTLSTIVMRRPNLGDMMDFPIRTGGIEEEAALVGALTGLRTEDLRGLDMEDYERLQDQLLAFRGQKRSERNSGEAAQDAGGQPVPADAVAAQRSAGPDA